MKKELQNLEKHFHLLQKLMNPTFLVKLIMIKLLI